MQELRARAGSAHSSNQKVREEPQEDSQQAKRDFRQLYEEERRRVQE